MPSEWPLSTCLGSMHPWSWIYKFSNLYGQILYSTVTKWSSNHYKVHNLGQILPDSRDYNQSCPMVWTF